MDIQENNKTSLMSGLVFIVEMSWREHSAPQGKMTCYSEPNSQCVAFDGIASLLCKIDALCDLNGHAERESAFRTLLKQSWVLPKESKKAVQQIENCKKLSFGVTVYYRQNYSIQGNFKAHGCKVQFRSGIELMKLINEAMSCTENTALLQKNDSRLYYQSVQNNTLKYAEG